MNDREKILLYLHQESFRRSEELEIAKGNYYGHKDTLSVMALLRCHIAKAVFDKLAHDLCALMDNSF